MQKTKVPIQLFCAAKSCLLYTRNGTSPSKSYFKHFLIANILVKFKLNEYFILQKGVFYSIECPCINNSIWPKMRNHVFKKRACDCRYWLSERPKFFCPISSFIIHESWLKFGNFMFSFQWGPKTTKLVILVVNWLDNVIATDSEVSLDWVEAATTVLVNSHLI